jgi:hypothetical protein
MVAGGFENDLDYTIQYISALVMYERIDIRLVKMLVDSESFSGRIPYICRYCFVYGQT